MEGSDSKTLPSALFQRVPAVGRIRLRNRVGFERPICVKDGPTPRNGSSMVGTAGSLWVFGGLTESETRDDFGNPSVKMVVTNDMFSFDLKLQIWKWHGNTNVGDIPAPRWKHGCCLIEDASKMLVVGGALDAQCKSFAGMEPYVFDFTAECWTRVRWCFELKR